MKVKSKSIIIKVKLLKRSSSNKSNANNQIVQTISFKYNITYLFIKSKTVVIYIIEKLTCKIYKNQMNQNQKLKKKYLMSIFGL